MPLEPEELKVVTLCSYPAGDFPFRPDDHTASKMVKAVKGDPINGYFGLKLDAGYRKFDENNIHEYRRMVPDWMCHQILKRIEGSATIVPIPNSHVISADTQNFRTLALALAIAECSKGQLTALPALVFKEPQQKAREGGPRRPLDLYLKYKVIEQVQGQIVLMDDVKTNGGHLIGAKWAIEKNGPGKVILACAFGRTVREQVEDPVSVLDEILDAAFPFQPI